MIGKEDVFVIACCMYAISLSGRQCTDDVLKNVSVVTCHHYHPAYSSIQISEQWIQGFRVHCPFLLFFPNSKTVNSRAESIRLLKALIPQKRCFKQWIQTVWAMLSVSPKFKDMQWKESYVGDMERILAKFAVHTAL